MLDSLIFLFQQYSWIYLSNILTNKLKQQLSLQMQQMLRLNISDAYSHWSHYVKYRIDIVDTRPTR